MRPKFSFLFLLTLKTKDKVKARDRARKRERQRGCPPLQPQVPLMARLPPSPRGKDRGPWTRCERARPNGPLRPTLAFVPLPLPPSSSASSSSSSVALRSLTVGMCARDSCSCTSRTFRRVSPSAQRRLRARWKDSPSPQSQPRCPSRTSSTTF